MRFAPIWRESSTKPIFLNSDHVYMSEDRLCYSLSGTKNKKRKLFQFEKENISEFGTSRAKASAFYNRLRPGEPTSSCFVTLMNNAVLRHCDKTGALLNTVFLGDVFSFKTMEVETQANMIVVQSVSFTKFKTRNTNTIEAMLLMSIHPFQFTHLFELTPDVAGQDVKGVRVTKGMLLLSAASWTRVYSLNDLLVSGSRLCSCGFDNDCSLGHGPVGRYPFGVPVNFRLSQLPPMLLQVRSDPKHMSFGCIPVNCLFTPANQQKTFSLMRVSDERTIELQVDVPTIFDECSFHPSLANVLIHQSNHSLSFYKYSSDDSSLVQLFRIKTDALQNPEECIRERASGRPVRSTAFTGAFLVHARTLFEHHYDSSIDMHLMRATSSTRIMQSSLYLYTPAGELVREVKIRQSLKTASACSFAISFDRLSVIEHQDGVFYLTVYQLQRTADICEQKSKLNLNN